MDKQINDLAEQAVQLVANECTNGDVSRLNTDSYHVKDLVNQKFAELIVRDSIHMFANNGYDESVDMLIEHWNIDPRIFRS